jgi:hypothetical protein
MSVKPLARTKKVTVLVKAVKRCSGQCLRQRMPQMPATRLHNTHLLPPNPRTIRPNTSANEPVSAADKSVYSTRTPSSRSALAKWRIAERKKTVRAFAESGCLDAAATSAMTTTSRVTSNPSNTEDDRSN